MNNRIDKDEEGYDSQQIEEGEDDGEEEGKRNLKRRESIIFLQDLDLNNNEEDNPVTTVAFNADNITSEENQKAFRDLLNREKNSVNTKKNCVSMILDPETTANKEADTTKLSENVLEDLKIQEGQITSRDIQLHFQMQKSLDDMKKKISNLEIDKYKLSRECELVRREHERYIDNLKISTEETESYKVLLESVQSNINDLAEQKAKTSGSVFCNLGGGTETKGKSFNVATTRYASVFGSNYTTNYSSNNTFVNNYQTEQSNFISLGKFSLGKTIISKQTNFSFNSYMVSSTNSIFVKFNDVIKNFVNTNVNEKSEENCNNGLKEYIDWDCDDKFKVLLDLNQKLIQVNKGQGEEIDKLTKDKEKMERDFNFEKDKLLLQVYRLSVEFQQLKVVCINKAIENEEEEDEESEEDTNSIRITDPGLTASPQPISENRKRQKNTRFI